MFGQGRPVNSLCMPPSAGAFHVVDGEKTFIGELERRAVPLPSVSIQK